MPPLFENPGSTTVLGKGPAVCNYLCIKFIIIIIDNINISMVAASERMARRQCHVQNSQCHVPGGPQLGGVHIILIFWPGAPLRTKIDF